jgi:hypothetical protein
MPKKNINMQPCKDGNWLGGRIWTVARNASWIDLMVTPCHPIELLANETSLVANNTKP